MKEDQSKAPIIEAIQQYLESGIIPFTTPGHKLGKGVLEQDREFLEHAFRNDMPMQNGADDRRESKKVTERAENLMAKAVGADETFFSTNGSSLSAHVAILTVANSGDKILMARNTHKSGIGALVMAEVTPVFLEPEIDEQLDVEHGIRPTYLEQMLKAHPDVKGVFVVSPTYYGVTSDIKSLAQICHDHHVPLIVDEAWGPHFPFHDELPASALSCGADMSFGSIHKTMNGLGQSSIVNVQGKLIDRERFTLCFDMFESTSPSTTMLATIDAARRQMALHGQELWGKALELSRKARRELAEEQGLYVIGKEILGRQGTFELDETKLVIDVSALGVNGYMAADWMLENFKVTFELITHRHLMALISIADTDETVGHLIRAVKALCQWARETKPNSYVQLPHHRDLGTELVMLPTKAFFGKTHRVKLDKAEGEIIAEMVSPYPPGIPRLVPGERVTVKIIEYLKTGIDIGMFVLDASDTELKTLRVVKLD